MKECGCYRCVLERNPLIVQMHVCPDCGNKRCPRATDHREHCTSSNEPGQPGSRYSSDCFLTRSSTHISTTGATND